MTFADEGSSPQRSSRGTTWLSPCLSVLLVSAWIGGCESEDAEPPDTSALEASVADGRDSEVDAETPAQDVDARSPDASDLVAADEASMVDRSDTDADGPDAEPLADAGDAAAPDAGDAAAPDAGDAAAPDAGAGTIGESCAVPVTLSSGEVDTQFSLAEHTADQAFPGVCIGAGTAQLPDRVYRWRPAQDGYVRLSVDGISDARVAVFLDASCGELAYVRCTTAGASTLEFAVDADFDYHIVIASAAVAAASEQGRLRIRFNAGCSNVDLVTCSGACVDTAQNDAHCGGCGSGCDALEQCQAGVCACKPGYTRCGDECVRIEEDERHCGGCGEPCDQGQLCLQSQCTVINGESCANATRLVLAPQQNNSLSASFQAEITTASADVPLPRAIAGILSTGTDLHPVRDRAWVWTATEALNVQLLGSVGLGPFPSRGATYTAWGIFKDGCGPEHLIQARHAHSLEFDFGFRSIPGATYYIVGFEGPSYPPASVASLSGQLWANTAGSSNCPAGTTECGGGCVDLATSSLHCGACGNGCGFRATCQAGTCQCPDGYGYAMCDQSCVRVVSDPLHCGTCGHACAADSFCVDGTCTASGTGLSCATAIPIGTPTSSGVLAAFSLQGPNATSAWPASCDAGAGQPPLTRDARFFQFQATSAGTKRFTVYSELRDDAQIFALNQQECSEGAPTLDQSSQRFLRCGAEGFESPGTASVSFAAGEIVTLVVTTRRDGARTGTFSIIDYY